MRYMQTMLDIYQKSYRVIGTPFSFVQPAETAPADEAEPAAAGKDRHSGPVAAEGDDTINQLKGRVAELESLVSSLLPRKPGKR